MENIKQGDRISEYLAPNLKTVLFDELSDAYLEKAGIKDILQEVPVPVLRSDGGAITVLTIAKNMAFVIGCDPQFQYKDNYVKYILRNFDERFADGLLAEGVQAADEKKYEYACIMFRGAMQINPENANVYYCYGRACKDFYEQCDDETIIARFKAEALEAFEVATIKNPEFADPYYYLGYGYVNMGLYIKAKITWEEYVKLTKDTEDNDVKEAREEVEGRLLQLQEPVKIEEGYNLILTEKYQEGVSILQPYTEGRFKTWWPLWYYLGMAYSGMGDNDKAKEHFLEVLKLSPSNEDTMEKLVEIYTASGETDKVEKYSKKLEVVKANREADRKLVNEQGDMAGTPDILFDQKISEKLS